MSSEMNLSSILQSELYCTPTQIILLDAFTDGNYFQVLLDSLGLSDVDFIDHIRLIDFVSDAKIDGKASQKAQYVKYRIPILDKVLSLFERRMAQGMKERCVVIIAGSVEDSVSRTCLIELPLDVSNSIFWKTGHLPGVIRMVTTHTSSSQSTTIMKSFSVALDSIRAQYFELPRFESETTTKRVSGDVQAPIEEKLRPSNSHLLCSNPYDILVCSTSIQPIERVFREILPLQQLEAAYASKHLSSEYGSGGSLYLVEGRLISSVSGWRRTDWLVLAQSSYLPRYWCLDDKAVLDEFINLFKYRHWISRFDGLEEADLPNHEIVDFPDSTRKMIKKGLKEQSNLNFQRRKRESGWTYDVKKLVSLSSVQLKPHVPPSKVPATNSLESAPKSDWSALECETNPHRISEAHFSIFREFVSFLNREEKYAESLRVIRTFVRDSATSSKRSPKKSSSENSTSRTMNSSPPTKGRAGATKRLSPTKSRGHASSKVLTGSVKCPPDFDKLEGVALLGLGEKDEAFRMLEQYRSHLEDEEDDRRLLGAEKDELKSAERNRQSARVWSEVASIYCACGNYESAQSAAVKALELEGTLVAAHKTLVLAVARTGHSSFREEDWIFSFFASAKTLQMDEALAYYAKRTEKFPKSGFFWYGYAMLNFVVTRDIERSSEPLFQKALELLPKEGRVAEAFATFLFQARSAQIERIRELYELSLNLDPSNLIVRANSAAFLLFLRSAQLSRLDDGKVLYFDCEAHEVYQVKESMLVSESREAVLAGFDLAQNFLESVLFSVSLVDQHPQVYLECWFYVLCYTLERERLIQALQYTKASLRKGIRARNWDMHMHIRFLRRKHLLSPDDTHWIPRLALVIADKAPLDILDDWVLWCSLKSDKLVANLKLAPHSFRVCVSPSKRREQKEEFSPPNIFKSKSAPLSSMVSPSFKTTRRRAAPPSTSSPFTAKSKVPKTKSFVSPPSSSSSHVEKPSNSTTPTLSAKSSNNGAQSKATLKKSSSAVSPSLVANTKPSQTPPEPPRNTTTPTRRVSAFGTEEEDDILNLLVSGSQTLGTPTSTVNESLTPVSSEEKAKKSRSGSSETEKIQPVRLSRSSSSAGSVLFGGSSSTSSAVRKTKSPPLSASTAKNKAKTTAVKNRSSPTAQASSPLAIGSEDQEQIWKRIMEKYNDGDSPQATKVATRETRPVRSPGQVATSEVAQTNATSPLGNFNETAAKRPIRSSAGGVPAAKRSKRL